MRRWLTLILTLTACKADEATVVDHASFWGSWATTEAVQSPFAEIEVAVDIEGTETNGTDTRFVWRMTSHHMAPSTTPGCTSTLWYEGDWRAVCFEELTTDPSEPMWPQGKDTVGGCVEWRLTAGRTQSEDCTDPSHNRATTSFSASELDAVRTRYDYARIDGEALWVSWDPTVVLWPCDGCGPGPIP